MENTFIFFVIWQQKLAVKLSHGLCGRIMAYWAQQGQNKHENESPNWKFKEQKSIGTNILPWWKVCSFNL